MFLDEVKEWILKQLIQPNTQTILLIGPWVSGQAKFTSDIDIVVVAKRLPPSSQNERINFKNWTIDVWYNDKNYMENILHKEVENLSDIFQKSYYLEFLLNCRVWFEKEPYIEKYIDLAKNWKWNPEDKRFLKIQSKPPVQEWAKKAYEENIKLLELAVKKFDEGKPISHRVKDYPELMVKVEKNEVEMLFKSILSSYKRLGIEREWIEMTYARKAIKDEDWNTAFACIKGILRFLIRKHIPSAPRELRNPILWRMAEEQDLPKEIINLMNAVYKDR
jgi:hypothetical protein